MSTVQFLTACTDGFFILGNIFLGVSLNFPFIVYRNFASKIKCLQTCDFVVLSTVSILAEALVQIMCLRLMSSNLFNFLLVDHR